MEAIFAAGCFWGVQQTFDTIPGVVATTVGYTGGHTEDPTYKEVCQKDTGHAEAVKVEFDSQQVSYTDLLKMFWHMHDPTTKNRQGPDIGSQYRSAIFYYDEEQRRMAEESKRALEQSGAFKRPIVTEIVEAGEFYEAEEYHQKYLQKRGGGGCHI